MSQREFSGIFLFHNFHKDMKSIKSTLITLPHDTDCFVNTQMYSALRNISVQAKWLFSVPAKVYQTAVQNRGIARIRVCCIHSPIWTQTRNPCNSKTSYSCSATDLLEILQKASYSTPDNFVHSHWAILTDMRESRQHYVLWEMVTVLTDLHGFSTTSHAL